MSPAPPIDLLPGETVIQHSNFTPYLIRAHLKTTVILTDRRVVMTKPGTIFWFIPHGYTTHTTPLEAVSDVACGDGRQSGAFGGMATMTALVFLAVLFILSMIVLWEGSSGSY